MRSFIVSSPGGLTALQVAEFYQNGYIVVRGLIDPETVEFAKQTIDDFIAKQPEHVLYEPEVLQMRTPESLSLEERIGAVRGIHQQVFKDARFLALAKYAGLIQALISLLGEDIKVLQDMALIKPPRIGSEKPPHQDAAYFEIEPFDQVVGTWWALDKATVENGCMFVWPGTHRLPIVRHTHEEGSAHKIIDPALIDVSGQLALPMEPGDVLLFASRLFHFTPPNRSEFRRRSLQIHYAGARCQLMEGRKARPYTLVHGASQAGGI